MGYTNPSRPTGGGASGAPPLPPGIDFSSVTAGAAPDEAVVLVAGPEARSITGVYFFANGPSGLVADDTDGLSFTVNVRNATAGLVSTDYASTAEDVDTLHGIGSVDVGATGKYVFETPLTVPANGSATIEFTVFGAGIELDRFRVGVLLA